MICPRCNTRNATVNRFCRGCGRPLAAEREQVEANALRSAEGASAASQRDIPEPPVPLHAPPVDPAVARDLMDRSKAEHEAGRIQRSLELARRAAELDPNAAHIRSAYALLLEEAGDLREAARQYQAAISLDPKDKMDRYRLKNLAERLGEPALSLSQGKGALDAGKPRSRRPSLGRRLRGLRQRPFFWASVAGLAAAALVVFLGLLWIHFAPLSQASASAMTADANLGPARQFVELGLQQYRAGNYEEAYRQFQLALAADPGDGEATYWLDVARQKLQATVPNVSELPMGTLDLTQPQPGVSNAPPEGPVYNSSGVPTSAQRTVPSSPSAAAPAAPALSPAIAPPPLSPLYGSPDALRGSTLAMATAPAYSANAFSPGAYSWAQSPQAYSRRPTVPPSGLAQPTTVPLSQYLQQTAPTGPPGWGPSVRPWMGPGAGSPTWAQSWGAATQPGAPPSVHPEMGGGPGIPRSSAAGGPPVIHIQRSAGPGVQTGGSGSGASTDQAFRLQQEGYNRRAAGDRQGALEAFRKALDAYHSQGGPDAQEAAASLQAVIRQLERTQ